MKNLIQTTTKDINATQEEYIKNKTQEIYRELFQEEKEF